jgi:hypothetical protein
MKNATATSQGNNRLLDVCSVGAVVGSGMALQGRTRRCHILPPCRARALRRVGKPQLRDSLFLSAFIRVHPRSSAAHICFLNFRVGPEEKHIWPDGRQMNADKTKGALGLAPNLLH